MAERLAITDPLLIAALVASMAFLVSYGRIDAVMGVFGAAMFWAYAVDVGNLVLLWWIVGVLIMSAGMRVLRESSHGKRYGIFDRRNLGILAWVTFWTLWIFLIFFLFQSEYADRLMRNILVFNVLSFGIVLFFITDLKNVRAMAYSFVATSLVSGVISLWFLPMPVDALLQDPEFRFRGLTGINYLSFGVPFALSVLLAFVIFGASKRYLEKLIAVVAMVLSVYFLVLTGARQSILGVGIALGFVLLWMLKERQSPRWAGILLIGIVGVVTYYMYRTTALGSRWTLVGEAYEIRVDFWMDAWELFLQSPIWGNGLDYAGPFGTAHNLLLDTMAGQGLVGLIFLLGFLIFPLFILREMWNREGAPELKVWQIGGFGALVYILVHTAFSGAVAGVPHLFWVIALIWRMGMMVEKVEVGRGITEHSIQLPRSRQGVV